MPQVHKEQNDNYLSDYVSYRKNFSKFSTILSRKKILPKMCPVLLQLLETIQ